MPATTCPKCKQQAPIKWDAKDRRWRFWPHGPEDKRCPASGQYATLVIGI